MPHLDVWHTTQSNVASAVPSGSVIWSTRSSSRKGKRDLVPLTKNEAIVGSTRWGDVSASSVAVLPGTIILPLVPTILGT
jgi:hypothetical protein